MTSLRHEAIFYNNEQRLSSVVGQIQHHSSPHGNPNADRYSITFNIKSIVGQLQEEISLKIKTEDRFGNIWTDVFEYVEIEPKKFRFIIKEIILQRDIHLEKIKDVSQMHQVVGPKGFLGSS